MMHVCMLFHAYLREIVLSKSVCTNFACDFTQKMSLSDEHCVMSYQFKL